MKKPLFPSVTRQNPSLRFSWPPASEFSLLLARLPTSPVVYIFEGKQQKPLYIGKTIHPPTRIRHHLKTAHFVLHTHTIKLYPVSSDLEAILLEAKLIRLHRPHYNQALKDNKSEIFITITGQTYPEIKLTRGTNLPSKIFAVGPFTSSHQAQQILKTARRIFHFCAKPNNTGDSRHCFYYHLQLCDGACVGQLTPREYRQKIGLLKKFLNGQSKLLLKKLTTQINQASRRRDFETAQNLKNIHTAVYQVICLNQSLTSFLTTSAENRVRSLKEVLDTQGISTNLERIEAYDIATLNQKETTGSLVVFYLGAPQKEQYRRFLIHNPQGGDPAAMREMLQRRFHNSWPRPGLILLDGGIPQLSLAKSAIPADIPRISLAKKQETIIFPTASGYKQLNLPRSSPALKLLQHLRNEAHRFATTYHRQKRDKTVFRELVE